MQRLLVIFVIILAGQVYGQSMLTRREVYDFNVGDVFEYDNRRIFANDRELGLKIMPDGAGFRKTILARRDSKNLDSIIYKVKIDEYSCILKNNQRYFTNSSRIVDEFYTTLDSCVCEEHKNWELLYYSDTIYFHPIWKVRIMRYGGMYDVCNGFSTMMGEGIGLVYYKAGTWPNYEQLIYYKKGNVEFGRHDVNFEQKTIPIPSGQVFYPNPVVSTLYFWEPLRAGTTLKLLDGIGKEVMKITDAGLLSEIDMSYLAKGIYYLVLDDTWDKTVHKLAKQ